MNPEPSASTAGTISIGGLVVNRLGFGAMRVTGREIWGDPPDKKEAIAALRRVVGLGVNFIDTAQSLYPYPDDLVIATKGGLIRPEPGRWERDGRPEHLRKACEDSLKRLRLEQMPLYQLHKPDPKIPCAESVGALAELMSEGTIRSIGLSTVTEDQYREAGQIVSIVSVQNKYNATDRSSQSMLATCELQGAAFIPWAPRSTRWRAIRRLPRSPPSTA